MPPSSVVVVVVVVVVAAVLLLLLLLPPPPLRVLFLALSTRQRKGVGLNACESFRFFRTGSRKIDDNRARKAKFGKDVLIFGKNRRPLTI